MSYTKWTPELEKRLIELAPTHSQNQIASIIGLSQRTVNSKCHALGLATYTDRHTWTPEEDKILRQLIGTVSKNEIANKLKVTKSMVTTRAQKLGMDTQYTPGKLSTEQVSYILSHYPTQTIRSIATHLGCSWKNVHDTIIRETGSVEVTRKDWSSAEVAELKQLAQKYTVKEIAKKLGRTENSITLKCRRLRIELLATNRNWTEKDLSYLEEHWGNTSISRLCSVLHRTKLGIIQKAQDLELGSFYKSGDKYIVGAEFVRLSGIKWDRIIRTLVPKYNFPIKEVKLSKKHSIYLIDIDKSLKWLEKHQDLFDASKISQYLYSPEPKWLLDKERADSVKKEHLSSAVTYKHWTDHEHSILKAMRAQGKSVEEIAQRLNRTVSSVNSRCSAMGIYAPDRSWTTKDLQYIKENYTKYTDAELAKHLGKPVSSVESHRLKLGLKRSKSRAQKKQTKPQEERTNDISLYRGGDKQGIRHSNI